MQVILQEDVEKLGTRGQVLEVAAGYARNALLPRKLAIEATSSNRKHLEKLKTVLAKRTATERDAAQKQADALNSVTVRLARKAGENDQLFGSVTTADIAESIATQGYKVDKRQVQLAEPIKLIGEFQVAVKLYQEISANVKVVVEKEAYPSRLARRARRPSFSLCRAAAAACPGSRTSICKYRRSNYPSGSRPQETSSAYDGDWVFHRVREYSQLRGLDARSLSPHNAVWSNIRRHGTQKLVGNLARLGDNQGGEEKANIKWPPSPHSNARCRRISRPNAAFLAPS